jgi:hypothetical protein
VYLGELRVEVSLIFITLWHDRPSKAKGKERKQSTPMASEDVVGDGSGYVNLDCVNFPVSYFIVSTSPTADNLPTDWEDSSNGGDDVDNKDPQGLHIKSGNEPQR